MMVLRTFLLNYTIIFSFVPKPSIALYFQVFYLVFEVVSHVDLVGLKLTV